MTQLQYSRQEIVATLRRTGFAELADEALRVLKNEIRKHRPLSVALDGAVEPAIEEMRERGVLPDLQVS